MKTSILILLLVGIIACSAKWVKPDFCGNSQCPHFSVEDERDGYDVRKYKEAYWVVVNITDTKYEMAYTKAAAKLMKYFKDSEMQLTTPILSAVKLSKDAKESEQDYDFSMWIDEQEYHEDEPPKPEDKDLEIIKYPEITVAVREFGGFATENTILREATGLHEQLTDDDEDFDDDMVFVAVYDPAVKLLNRHNEVHVVIKGGSSPDYVAPTDVLIS